MIVAFPLEQTPLPGIDRLHKYREYWFLLPKASTLAITRVNR